MVVDRDDGAGGGDDAGGDAEPGDGAGCPDRAGCLDGAGGRRVPRCPGECRVGAGPVAVLTNTTAGRGRYATLLPEVVAALAVTGRPVRMLDVRTRRQALTASREAVADGAAAIVAFGGDGTVHLALQAVAGTPVALGIVPTGTGNDFATALGLPTGPLAATAARGAARGARRGHPVDLARVEGGDRQRLWYGAVLGAGFDTFVNDRANRMTFPRGPRRYDLAILAELVGLRSRRYTLRLDGVVCTVDAVLVAVGNTTSYGGGMRICPDADPTDGHLDVVIGHRMSRLTLARLAPQVRRGRHVGHPLVTVARARTVEVSAEGVTAYVDGERGFRLPVKVRCVPGALTLLGGPVRSPARR